MQWPALAYLYGEMVPQSELLSSGAYNALGTSGFVKLPSERTLRDYTHFIKSRSGFHDELDQHLTDEAKLQSLPEWKKHVVLVFDWMKPKESLVYTYVCMYNVHTYLHCMYKHEQWVCWPWQGERRLTCTYCIQLEQSKANQHPPVATHMLDLMVRGIFSDLRFPYAHFQPDRWYSLFNTLGSYWEDGTTWVQGDGDYGRWSCPQSEIFQMHSTSKGTTCYKTRNPYTDEDRFVSLVSDVPHMMKITRNCWSHSFGHGWTRTLRVSMHVDAQKCV